MQWSIKELEEFAARFYEPVRPNGQETKLLLVPYAYTIPFANVAANTTQSQQLSITANADFIHVATSIRANAAQAAQTIANVPLPLWRLLITDSGTNEQYTNAPIDIGNFATKIPGSGYSDVHSYPRIVSGRSSLTLQVTSYEASQAYYADIALIGMLVRVFSGGYPVIR